MKRTTIMLPEDLDARLRYEARRRGVSLADVAREAIAAYVVGTPTQALSFIGIGDGDEDGSEHVDELIQEAIARRHERR